MVQGTCDTATEEHKFFPRLLAVFGDADWAGFDSMLADGHDSLLGPTIEKYYRTLHKRILSTAL